MKDATVTFTIQVRLPESVQLAELDEFKTKVKDVLDRYVFDILNNETFLTADEAEETEAEVTATDKYETIRDDQMAEQKARSREAAKAEQRWVARGQAYGPVREGTAEELKSWGLR